MTIYHPLTKAAVLQLWLVAKDVNVFIFQKNYRFVMITTTKNRKTKRSFLKTIVFLKSSFLKWSF